MIQDARSFFHRSLYVSLAAAMAVAAQSMRCDLVGVDTTLNGHQGKTCLDVSALKNQTVVIPDNVTRLDNDGFALCQSQVTTGGNTDIVYVYDNSGSMNASLYYFDGTDTLFYYDAGHCTNAGNNQPTATIRVWNAGGTAQVNKTVTRLASNDGCIDYSGDPFNTKARAYWLALANQGTRATQSTAGIMSFTSSVQ